MLVLAADHFETKVSYHAGDTSRTFTLDKAIDGEALFWYEMPDLDLNNKGYLESKDNDVFGTMITKYHCKSAGTVEDAKWRRPDPAYLAMVSKGLTPCGLSSIAMFTDSFLLTRVDVSPPVAIVLEQTDVAIAEDDDVYKKKLVQTGTSFTLKGKLSWITSGPPLYLYEHWKVWIRSPPGPVVRNLWARVPGGLPRGTYRVNFTSNSDIWTRQWQVSEKRVVLAPSHALGSVGALETIGVVCIVFGGLEFVFFLLFLLCPERRDRSKGTSES